MGGGLRAGHASVSSEEPPAKGFRTANVGERGKRREAWQRATGVLIEIGGRTGLVPIESALHPVGAKLEPVATTIDPPRIGP